MTYEAVLQITIVGDEGMEGMNWKIILEKLGRDVFQRQGICIKPEIFRLLCALC